MSGCLFFGFFVFVIERYGVCRSNAKATNSIKDIEINGGILHGHVRGHRDRSRGKLVRRPNSQQKGQSPFQDRGRVP